MIDELEVKYRDYCYVMSILCNRAGAHYSFIKQIFLVILVIPSSCMAVINGAFNETALKPVNIIVNAFVAILLAIQNTLKIPERADMFNQMSVKFLKLQSEIETNINLGQMTNDKLQSYINSYNLLIEQISFNFPCRIKKLVKNKYNNRHLPHILCGDSPPSTPISVPV